jgi:hypothetical protein
MNKSLISNPLQIEKDLASGHPYARLLYITPESLFSPKFLKSIKTVVAQKELRRLVVDEAHCISVGWRFRKIKMIELILVIVCRNGEALSGQNTGNWGFFERISRTFPSWRVQQPIALKVIVS